MFVFRQLIDPVSSTYTYLLGDSESGEAVLIDPVLEQVRRDSALISELGLNLLLTLETHVHADHVTGAALMKKRVASEIALSEKSGATGADRYLTHGEHVFFGERYLEIRETPGHTNGCITFVLDDESMAFTGDCLLVRGCGRTDFQEGDSREMYRAVHLQIFTLPDSCLIYPGHDYRGLTVSSVGEEKRLNPRLGGALSENDFVGYIDNLGLDHPRLMDIAVPANLRCGYPEDGETFPAEPEWAPLTFTFGGIWEIDPHWVEEHMSEITLVDVREADEFEGPLGHISGAVLIPLGKLSDRASELGDGKPVVTVCRAGGRSAHASQILGKSGIANVANLAGGMLNWRAQRFPVVGGSN